MKTIENKIQEQIVSSNFYNNGINSKLSINIVCSNGKSRTMSANVLKSNLKELMAGVDMTDKYFHKENGVYKYSNPKN